MCAYALLLTRFIKINAVCAVFFRRIRILLTLTVAIVVVVDFLFDFYPYFFFNVVAVDFSRRSCLIF